MHRAVPLRVRVTLLYMLLGLVLSLLFAGAMDWFGEDYERALLESTLKGRADELATGIGLDPDTVLPRSREFSAYLRRADGSGEVPPELAAMGVGVEEVERGEEDEVHVGVFDTRVGRIYLRLDPHEIEAVEFHLERNLVIVIIAGTLLSSWLGWLLAGAVVRPVRRLADAVQELPSQPVQTRLAMSMPADELGRLARAFDDYQARLIAAEAAERQFFADASHELRTPLAVVRSATEILLEDGADIPQLAPRLSRLDRGIRELSDLVDALLRLARRRIDPPQAIELDAFLCDLVARNERVASGRVQAEVEVTGIDWHFSLPEAGLIFSCLLRRMMPSDARGTLRVTAREQQVHFQFRAETPSPPAPEHRGARPGDSGLGMTLIGRLTRQVGWTLDESRAADGIVIVSMSNGRA